MATVIEREREVPAERRVIVERETDSGAGWAVALILILAILAVAAFVYFRYFNGPSNTINVSLPQVTTPAPAAQTPVTTPAPTTQTTGGSASGAAAGSATTPAPAQ